MKRPRFLALLPIAAICIGAGACSSTNGSGPGDGGGAAAQTGGDGDLIGCDSQGLPVDTYSPGMKKVGKNGLYTFVLESASPGPPAAAAGAAGNNTWMVKVVDASGGTVSGATLSLPKGSASLWPYNYNPYMPKHDHGTSYETVTNHGDGTVTLVMNFFMSGVWQTFVEASDGTNVDGAMFAFCVP